jgi:type I restriction-modification system DNA methylase subunit
MSNLNKTNKEEKDSTVFTPEHLSKTLYNIVTEQYNIEKVFDPCIGINGGMTKYYYENGCDVMGADIVNNIQGNICSLFINMGIKDLKNYKHNITKPDIIVMNPPFNGNGRGKNLLFPHLFLKEVFDAFGYDIPVIMITGDNFLNNNRTKSSRLQWLSDNDINITSIMTLPLDVFDDTLFNAQVLFFNMPKLKPYYIYDIRKDI